MPEPPPDTLSDADICRMLERKLVGKLELVATSAGTYKRDSDGTWYLLDGGYGA